MATRRGGNDLPPRLNGMFAFAVVDRTRRRVFMARDRFGEKPLYWCKDAFGNCFRQRNVSPGPASGR